jgi:hypothetical protein
MYRLALPILVSACAWGQVPPPPPLPPAPPAGVTDAPGRIGAPAGAAAVPTDPSQLATIEGKAVHISTGEPLRKVNLSLMGIMTAPGGQRRQYAATTDAEGKFKIADIEPGRYVFAATRFGFARQTYGSRGGSGQGTNLTLAPAQKITDIVFKLTPQGVIMGRVVDEDGDPIPQVLVQTNRLRFLGGRRQMTPMGGSQSNDIGEFRIAGLMPGRYFLSATNRSGMFPDPTISSQPPAEEAYGTVYYPGAIDPAGAVAIDIQPGSEVRGADIRMVKQRVVRLRGRLENAGRQQTMIQLLPKVMDITTMMDRNMTMARPDGSFEMRSVRPGSYVLLAQVQDGDFRGFARLPVEVGDRHIDNLVMTVQPAFSINGRFRLEGQPQQQTQGQQSAAPAVRINLRPFDPNQMISFGGGSGAVRDDGSFSLQSVVGDIYQVDAFGIPDGAYIKSARLGDLDVLEKGLDLTGGGAGGVLEIVASMDGGQISGMVVNDKDETVTTAVVTLVPASGRARLQQYYKQANTDQSGSFVIRGLAPGDYRIFAWEEVDPMAWRDPEYVKPFEAKGKAVTIREKGFENVRLKWIPNDPDRQ